MSPGSLAVGRSLLGALRAALGDHRFEVAAAVLGEVEAERLEIAAALGRDRRGGLEWLGRLAERARARYLALLAERSGRSPLAWARLKIDEAIATDEVEELDRDDVSAERRREIIEDLARFNRVHLAHHRFASLAAPLIEAAARRRAGAPVRVLELGSGHGELAFHLERWAARRAIPVDVRGSDVAQVYVDLGNRKAEERGSRVRYVRLDAVDLALEDGSEDVVMLIQGLHHFPAGAAARLLAEATRVGRSALVADGRRSLAILLGGAVVIRVAFPVMLHDFLISARKFYSEAEMTLLAGLTPAAGRARVFFAPPGYSAIRFDAAG